MLLPEIAGPSHALYPLILTALVLGRAADFLSTWIATPNLELEANPIAKKLGWRLGIAINVVLCLILAIFPLSAIIVTTLSLLVASRNFQFAWLMRTMGEWGYKAWMGDQVVRASLPLLLFCLFAQTGIYALIGAALTLLSPPFTLAQGIGMGFVAYALAIALFTLPPIWRMHRSARNFEPPRIHERQPPSRDFSRTE